MRIAWGKASDEEPLLNQQLPDAWNQKSHQVASRIAMLPRTTELTLVFKTTAVAWMIGMIRPFNGSRTEANKAVAPLGVNGRIKFPIVSNRLTISCWIR